MLFFPTTEEDAAYFRSQGYTGSINDMHFKALGDSGYTGSLNDRIRACLTFKYGSYYEAMKDLRNGTSVFALSSYIINGFDPALVFDFKGNYFRKGSSASTFPASITHAATTNATMVDSDGLLKWRPHNLQVHSGDFSNSAWSKSAAITVDTSYVAPDGTSTASKLTSTGAGGASGVYDSNPKGTGMSLTCFMKAGSSGVYGWIEGIVGGTSPNATFDLENGTVVRSRECDASIEPVGNGWFRCAVANTTSPISFFSVGGSDNAVASSPWSSSSLTQGKFIYAWGAQLNRSDLGGMVNNPDASTGLESYVSTTTTPVYLSRRGHHIYNGSAWVNEGILHESEARTNILTSSGDVTGTGWVGQATAGTVTAGSPFGNYQTLSPASSAANLGPSQRYQIGKTITSGATYVGWALVKYSAGSGWFVVNMYDTGKQSEQAYFDLQNGVVGSKDALIIDHGMIDYGDGWWLCWASSNATSGSGGMSNEMPNGDGVQSCSAADVILIAGSQFELGATPSSYIPTTSTTVTRAAETLTVPAANLPYDSTNMSIQMDGKMTGDTLTPVRWLLDANNSILLETGSNNFSFTQEAVGTVDTVTGGSFTSGTNVPFNLATRNGSTFINGAISGTALTANTTPTALPNLSSTDLNLGYGFMGTIGEFRMWSEDLTDVGIAEAST